VDSRFFAPNIDALAARFEVFAPDFRGHGHTPDVEGPFSYGRLAQDTIEFIEATVAGPAYLVGHSVGAGVALLVALRRPDLVRQLVLISGAFHHNGLLPAMNEGGVDAVVQAFGATYGEVSPDGEDHYPVVVTKVLDMDRRDPALKADELKGVASRTLVLASDDDIISLEHTLDLYRGIPNCELAVVPGTSHFLTQEKPQLCNTPVPTVAPTRRAQSQLPA
jgi:pimeloyl-ACP methyl ester carboxylesterase